MFPEDALEAAEELKGHVWRTKIRGHVVEIRVVLNSCGLPELTHKRQPELNP